MVFSYTATTQGTCVRKELKTLDNTIITLGSVTYAMKARRLLLHEGIRSRLVKVLPENTDNGCTHGLAVASARFFDAVVILKKQGIPYSVYRGGDVK